MKTVADLLRDKGNEVYSVDSDVSVFDAIKKMGVEIKTNSPVGNGGVSLDDLKKQYSAILLAVGAQNSMKLNVPGEDANGVLQALSFLKDVNTGK